MGDLLLRRRRRPLGELPPARFGVRPGAAGLAVDVSELEVEWALAIDPERRRDYLTRVASRWGDGWAVRFEGLLPATVRASPVLNRFIPVGHVPRIPAADGHDLLDQPLLSHLLARP